MLIESCLLFAAVPLHAPKWCWVVELWSRIDRLERAYIKCSHFLGAVGFKNNYFNDAAQNTSFSTVFFLQETEIRDY